MFWIVFGVLVLGRALFWTRRLTPREASRLCSGSLCRLLGGALCSVFLKG